MGVEHLLQMKGITKRFGETAVLRAVDLAADRGQVHALLGENGAGKSTLMKILAGWFEADEGEIHIGGEPALIASPRQAQELGIAMIYQELKLFQDLSIAENVYMGREPLKKWNRLIDWEAVYRETGRYLQALGLDLDARTVLKSLGPGQQKFVEIIKALSQNARILIMDEPTASLTEGEREVLFGVIGRLKQLGVCVLYISHRLEEIKRIADRVTVLRDGEAVLTCSTADVELDDIVRCMVGKPLDDRYPKLKVKSGRELLRVENLSYQGLLKNIGFEVRRGEILALTGLSGSGRRLLAKVLCGIEGPYEGTIHLNGRPYARMTPHLAKQCGLCYASGLYSDEGLIATSTISENITLSNLERVSSAGLLRAGRETGYARDLIERLEITCDEKELAGSLSGGKQKKVVLAKWLFANAQVLIFDEPTAGIDVSSKSDIYNIMNEMVLSGASVIMISSDLSEVLGMADRILVMCGGELRRVLPRAEATKEKILYYASGGGIG